MKWKCPVHSKKLLPTNTRFGVRYSCPVKNCTVVLWDGSTSTPADYATRQARKAAHKVFDDLWKSKTLSRSDAYSLLANHLQLSKQQVHIGRFNEQQCKQVISFSNKTKDKFVNISIS